MKNQIGDRRLAREKSVKKEESEVWLLTYGDMVTLLLVFFVLLINPKAVEGYRLEMILAPFRGLGSLRGGNTLETGELVELGNNLLTLPAVSKGRAFQKERHRLVSFFEPEIRDKSVRIREDERGLVISLASDVFFNRASAQVDMEAARSVLQKLALLLGRNELADRTFRIEGHTDAQPTDPHGPWPTNWELSADRAVNVLHYLVDLGVSEKQFQVAGFADTVPLNQEQTPEAAADNRRVDVIILTDGLL